MLRHFPTVFHKHKNIVWPDPGGEITCCSSRSVQTKQQPQVNRMIQSLIFFCILSVLLIEQLTQEENNFDIKIVF